MRQPTRHFSVEFKRRKPGPQVFDSTENPPQQAPDGVEYDDFDQRAPEDDDGSYEAAMAAAEAAFANREIVPPMQFRDRPQSSPGPTQRQEAAPVEQSAPVEPSAPEAIEPPQPPPERRILETLVAPSVPEPEPAPIRRGRPPKATTAATADQPKGKVGAKTQQPTAQPPEAVQLDLQMGTNDGVESAAKVPFFVEPATQEARTEAVARFATNALTRNVAHEKRMRANRYVDQDAVSAARRALWAFKPRRIRG